MSDQPQLATKISDLPETTTIDLSDKIYAFKELDDESYSVEEVEISQLSAYIYTIEKVEQFQALYNNLLNLANNFYKFLDENYISPATAKSMFITSANFNNIYKNLRTTDTIVSNELADYCKKSYKEFLKAEAKANHKKLQREYQESGVKSIMANVPTDSGF